ncbi:MAG: TIM barrel protein [Flavobacteriaceae bacterium]|nr:TIM barrel protein [Flavobacteriaceae bacterium]
MNRRNFLKSSGALGALSCLPFSCMTMESSSTFKLGYQLYSIRDEMAKDPIATLKALKRMGFEDFEHYGFDASKGTYYGHDATEFKSILDDLGLSISSGHYPFAELFNSPEGEVKRYVDSCIKGAMAMNSNYIVWPWLAPDNRNLEGYKKLSQLLNVIGEQITNAGLGFAYHNHGYEFEDHQGNNGYRIITKGTDHDLVKLQLDMYWIMHEGLSTPNTIINEYPGRFVMWHIKDMHKTSRDYTELGNGSIDYTTIMPDPGISGLEYFYIEQGGNYTVNSMQSAKDSAKYFKENLQNRL